MNSSYTDVTDAGHCINSRDRFVILGAGSAALSAVCAIRSHNKTADITMLGNEAYLPYTRPMLTKCRLRDFDPRRYEIHLPVWYQENRITVHLNTVVSSIDSHNRVIYTETSEVYPYEKCIYALGSDAVIPPIPGSHKKGVFVIRRIDDVKKIRKFGINARRVVIIGGGAIGLEAAYEFRRLELQVSVLELLPHLMERQLDQESAKHLTETVSSCGIAVYTETGIEEISGNTKVNGVLLKDGRYIETDIVIMSCGIRACTEAAKTGGLEINRAIVIDNHMRTSKDGIFACGDCAEYRGENAATYGKALLEGHLAGMNACGIETGYEPPVPSVLLHSMDTSLFVIGDTGKRPCSVYRILESKKPAGSRIFEINPRRSGSGCFEKYFFRDGILCGGVLFGDLRKMNSLSDDLRNNITIDQYLQIPELEETGTLIH